jgi:hypothetical protein
MDFLIAWAIRLLELLFIIGCVGSVVVILLAGVEDIETVFASGEEESTVAAAPPAKQ